jgi:hypothetical protein
MHGKLTNLPGYLSYVTFSLIPQTMNTVRKVQFIMFTNLREGGIVSEYISSRGVSCNSPYQIRKLRSFHMAVSRVRPLDSVTKKRTTS